MGAGIDRCRASTERALHLAEQSAEIKEVVLISIWRQAVPHEGQPFDGRWVPRAEVPRVFSERLTQTINRLRAAGKQVTIIEPLFAVVSDVPMTLANNVAFKRNRPVDRPLAEYMTTFATVLEAFEHLGENGVRRISLIDPFCEDGRCRAIVDDRPLFTDNNHLAFSHSEIIAEQIQRQTAPQ